MILAGLALPGCAAGIIGAVAAIVGLAGSGGGSQAPAPDLPPVVRFIGAPELLVGPEGGPSRYRIRVRYSVMNEDEGTLAARVEAVRVDAGGEPIGDRVPAAALPSCGDPLDGIPSGVERSICWDVRGTPGFETGASMVRLLITAIEDDRENEAPQPSEPFLEGNTPLTVRNLTLAQNGEVLFGSFELVDAEADIVPADERFLQLDLEVEGSGTVRFDPALLGRPSFPAAPEPGAQGSFSLDLASLEAERTLPEALRVLSEPGFVATLAARLRVRDFLEEAFAESPPAALLFDNNELPLVAIDSVGLDDPQSGVVSIRYRIFDPDLNPAGLEVEVDLGDGLDFRPALELQTPLSEGRARLCAVDPAAPNTPGDCAGPAGAREHVFLWDALAQSAPAFAPAPVTLQLRARDREPGPAVSAAPAAIRLRVGFVRLREQPAGTGPVAVAAADFDQDGFSDLSVANQDSDNVTFLRQVILRDHVNLIIDPSVSKTLPATLSEPRVPPNHEIALSADALSGPTQIAILPAAPFDFPLALARETASRDRALVRLTLAASLLPATTMFAAPACLKLRVRDGAEDLVALGLADRSRLRLFRSDPATGEVRDVPFDPKAITSVQFGRGRILVPGLAFPITRFGTYVVTVEVDRLETKQP